MIKTIYVFAYVIVSMIFLLPFGMFAMVFHFLGLRRIMSNFIYWFGHLWAQLLIKITGCKVTVAGTENIPQKGGVCFVSNHDGFFDIILLFAYCGRPVGFMAKKELIFIPFLNAWIYMVGGLYLDRGSVKKALRSINKGVERIKSGGSMIIFPEGTRSKGRGLLPFHPGSLKLATASGVPIVPVALQGSYDVFEKTYRVTAAEVKITFCEPIDTATLPKEAKKAVLSDRIHSVINENLS